MHLGPQGKGPIGEEVGGRTDTDNSRDLGAFTNTKRVRRTTIRVESTLPAKSSSSRPLPTLIPISDLIAGRRDPFQDFREKNAAKSRESYGDGAELQRPPSFTFSDNRLEPALDGAIESLAYPRATAVDLLATSGGSGATSSSRLQSLPAVVESPEVAAKKAGVSRVKARVNTLPVPFDGKWPCPHNCGNRYSCRSIMKHVRRCPEIAANKLQTYKCKLCKKHNEDNRSRLACEDSHNILCSCGAQIMFGTKRRGTHKCHTYKYPC